MQVISHGFFAHDDWRVSDRLTLNLGLRYDLELGMTEAENRNVGPFDLTTTESHRGGGAGALRGQPAGRRPGDGEPVQRPWVATRICPAISRTRGMPISTTSSPAWASRSSSTNERCCEAACGRFVAPFQLQGVPGLITGINQIGYSRNTPIPVSNDNGLTFQANLSNPVPSNQLVQPVGSAQGLLTNLGNAPGNIWAADRVNPEFWRFSAGIERQLPWEMLFEVSYIGQRGTNQAILEALNYVPRAVPHAKPDPRQQRRNVPEPGCGEPISGTDARLTGHQRRHDRASTPAVRVSAVRFIGEPVRDRDDQHLLHRDGARLEHVPRRDFSPRQALHGRSDADDVLYVVPPAGAGRTAQPMGRARGPCRRDRSAASNHARQRRRAALRSRPPLRRWLESDCRRYSRRVAGEHEIRMAKRLSAGVQPEHLLRSGLRRSTRAEVGMGRLGQSASRRRRADHRHQLLLHDERPAVPQRRRASP